MGPQGHPQNPGPELFCVGTTLAEGAARSVHPVNCEHFLLHPFFYSELIASFHDPALVIASDQRKKRRDRVSNCNDCFQGMHRLSVNPQPEDPLHCT